MKIRLDEFQPGDIVVTEDDIIVIMDDFCHSGQERYITKMYHGWYIATHPYDNLNDWRSGGLDGTIPFTKIGHIYGLSVCIDCRHVQLPPRRWCACGSISEIPQLPVIEA